MDSEGGGFGIPSTAFRPVRALRGRHPGILPPKFCSGCQPAWHHPGPDRLQDLGGLSTSGTTPSIGIISNFSEDVVNIQTICFLLPPPWSDSSAQPTPVKPSAPQKPETLVLKGFLPQVRLLLLTSMHGFFQFFGRSYLTT
jgi:hypothetical protein